MHIKHAMKPDDIISYADLVSEEKVNLQNQENTLVGVDMAQAATNLSQAQTAYNSALAAIAKVVPVSLLDYLK